MKLNKRNLLICLATVFFMSTLCSMIGTLFDSVRHPVVFVGAAVCFLIGVKFPMLEAKNEK